AGDVPHADAARPRALHRPRRVGGACRRLRDPGPRREPRRANRRRLPERRRPARSAARPPAREALRRGVRVRLSTRARRRTRAHPHPGWGAVPPPSTATLAARRLRGRHASAPIVGEVAAAALAARCALARPRLGGETGSARAWAPR